MENKNEAVDHGKVLYHWSFPEFTQHERGQGWYVSAGIGVAALFVYAVVSRNVLFGFIVLISSLIVLLFHRSSGTVAFAITEDGIQVNSRFYAWENLKHFFVIYQPPEVKTLYFIPKSVFVPRIPVPLQDQNPVEIRQTLLKYLSEDITREHEPTSDQVSRMLKL